MCGRGGADRGDGDPRPGRRLLRGPRPLPRGRGARRSPGRADGGERRRTHDPSRCVVLTWNRSQGRRARQAKSE
ncbi:hypothetical protein SGPA1_11088 [Streptomyces misionensis JCM 4497]